MRSIEGRLRLARIHAELALSHFVNICRDDRRTVFLINCGIWAVQDREATIHSKLP